MKSATPQKSSAALWILTKSNLSVNVHCISCKGAMKAEFAHHSPPVEGGQFQMKDVLLKRRQCFSHLCLLLKMLTSQILVALPKLLLESLFCSSFLNVKVNQQAVQCKLLCWSQMICHAKQHFFKQPLERCGVNEKDHKSGDFEFQQHCSTLTSVGNDCERHFHSFLAATFLRFTLVCHSAGLHHDALSSNKPSLENRLVFAFKAGDGSRGRGGFPDKFSFCILDWNSKNQHKTKIWTDSNNAHILHSRCHHSANTRLSKDVWDEFLESGQE